MFLSVNIAFSDPLPSQPQDDDQPPAISSDDDGNPEWEIDEILRARTHGQGRRQQRQVLVKWTGYTQPTWEPLQALKNTIALIEFERRWGDARRNDGPTVTTRRRRKGGGGNVTG